MGERAQKVNQPRRAEPPGPAKPKAATNANQASHSAAHLRPLSGKTAAAGPPPEGNRVAAAGAASASDATSLLRFAHDFSRVPAHAREPEGEGGRAAPPIVQEVLRTQGRPLDSPTRRLMESRFGHDFSRVGVHADARAAESASAIGARAFTLNQHVVFGAGEYAPQTPAGRRLISHELAHVVQQSGDASAPPRNAGDSLRLGDAHDAAESEASRAADSLARGGLPSLQSPARGVPVIRRQPKAEGAQPSADDAALEKGREEVEKLFAEYREKTYKPQGVGGEFDPEALKDAAAVKAALTTDGRKYLRSEAGLAALKGLQGQPAGHALALFSKSWMETEDVSQSKAETDKEGVRKFFELIEPLLDKTYTLKPPKPGQEPAADEEQAEDEAPPTKTSFERYERQAVKDCYAVIAKLSDDAREYLRSEAGAALLDKLAQKPEGHALRLFVENWRAAESAQGARREAFESHYGKKVGGPLSDALHKEANVDKLRGHVRGAADPAFKAATGYQKKVIENRKLNDPAYAASEEAKQDIKDLESMSTMFKDVGDDLLSHWRVSRFFEKASGVALNPYLLTGAALPFFVPSPVKLPGAGWSNTAAGLLANKFLYKKAGHTIPIKFGKSPKVGLNIETNPIKPGSILLDKEPFWLEAFKSFDVDLKWKDLGKKERPWTLETKNKYTLASPPDATGTKVGPSFKGSVEAGRENKAADETFTGKLDYEFKPGALTLSSSQKFGDKKGSVTFSEGHAQDQNGRLTTFGVDVKVNIFTAALALNLPSNPAKKQTSKISLGVKHPIGPKEKSRTLSVDPDITTTLGGKDFVQALAAFLEYKDTKEFFSAALGYQLDLGGPIQKEEFGLALEKTWEAVSVYVGGLFGLSGGKSSRAEAVAGLEWMVGDSKKYGFFVEGTYGQKFKPKDDPTFGGSAGLVRDKSRLGVYLTNDPHNTFGLTFKQTFGPATWLKRKR